jgi:hypothetical protein
MVPATCRSYAEMVDAIVLRLVELNVQQLELDVKCGLANGHTGKLLSPVPIKHYGEISLSLHLQALGLRIVVEPDPERGPLISGSRLFKPRDAAAVLAARLRTREGQELLREARRRAGLKGAAKRRRLAREAAEAREEAAAKMPSSQYQPAETAIAG